MGSSVVHTLTTYFPSLKQELYGFPSWYWVFLIISLLVSWVIGAFLCEPFSFIVASLFRHIDHQDKNLIREKLRGPIHIFTSISIFLIFNAAVGEPERASGGMSIAIKFAIFFSIIYLAYGLIDLIFARMIRSHQNERSKIRLVLPLMRRIVKSLLVVITVLLILFNLGVDISGLIVGLGVGSLAIALAAQKILENLFGGAVLSLDQPFQVGDYCKCGDILGYIEEIGIRSTRIRTLDRTLVSIPNFKLSEMHIENYMEREKIRFYTILKFDLSTPVEKLQELLSEFEKILINNENFYKDIYRIRMIGVSDLGFEVEIYAFAKSISWHEFVRIREDILFDYVAKIEKLNIKLAVPSRNNFVYKAN